MQQATSRLAGTRMSQAGRTDMFEPCRWAELSALLNRCEDQLKRLRVELAERKRTGSNRAASHFDLLELSLDLKNIQRKLQQG
jgi:hypothetical protein